jgi:hypothetical protein
MAACRRQRALPLQREQEENEDKWGGEAEDENSSLPRASQDNLSAASLLRGVGRPCSGGTILHDLANNPQACPRFRQRAGATVHKPTHGNPDGLGLCVIF